MALTSATTLPTAVTTTSSLHPRLTIRDRLRFVLFLVIPIYARLCILPSLFSAFGHICIIGTIGICIAQFSGGIVSLGQVGDVACGLAISSFPGWGKLYSLTAWVLDIEGWRGIVIHWAFVATCLIFLLPENYGSDVKTLSAEYKHAYPLFGTYTGIFSAFIVRCFFWRREYSWYNVLIVWAILTSFVECFYLIRLNYICLCRSGKTVRENSWPYKDMFKKPWQFTDGYGKELTMKETLQWHSTGSIRPKT
ncbi:hypothetical protein CC86DRAFT_465320 [Ophiobolus disseminans]|uniref:Uncharacterized protein n=1 Tax=Ophiobolus disseminans TaxID=1469910 RepID=A0A6A7A5E3_9PLEO|nr:hypothetical protein CC86DRAFT_465320 [Ophiobolus disseminans]